MNFIISVVGLTLLLHDSSQTELVTLQLGDIQTLFTSAYRDKSLNLVNPDKNICSFAIKSKMFKIQNEPDIPHELYPKRDSDAYSVISHLRAKKVTARPKYRQPRPLENILQLTDDWRSYSDNSIRLDYINSLSVTNCHLFGNKWLHISDGFKKDNITFQFLLGKRLSNFPEPLAIIGKPNLTIIEKGVDFNKLSSKLKDDANKKEKKEAFNNWVNFLTDLQRIWIGVTITDYEFKKGRKNFNLKFSHMTKSLIFFSLRQYEPYIPEGTPIIRFTVENMDNNQMIKSIVVVPDYFGDKSAYFYGIVDINGHFTPKHYVQITFQ